MVENWYWTWRTKGSSLYVCMGAHSSWAEAPLNRHRAVHIWCEPEVCGSWDFRRLTFSVTHASQFPNMKKIKLISFTWIPFILFQELNIEKTIARIVVYLDKPIKIIVFKFKVFEIISIAVRSVMICCQANTILSVFPKRPHLSTPISSNLHQSLTPAHLAVKLPCFLSSLPDCSSASAWCSSLFSILWIFRPVNSPLSWVLFSLKRISPPHFWKVPFVEFCTLLSLFLLTLEPFWVF